MTTWHVLNIVGFGDRGLYDVVAKSDWNVDVMNYDVTGVARLKLSSEEGMSIECKQVPFG